MPSLLSRRGDFTPATVFRKFIRALLPALLLCAAGTAGFPLFAGEQSPNEPRELADLQAEALANNPELKAAGYERLAQAETVKQAAVLPDPMVGVNYSNDGHGPTLGQRDMSVLNFTYSQTLPWFGKRALRGEAAHHAASHSSANLRRAERDLRTAVAGSYWNLLADDALLRLNETLHENGKLLEAAARARYGAGIGPQSDVLRAQAELIRLGEQRNELEGDQEADRAALNALLGRPPGDPLPLAGSLPEVIDAPDASELLAGIEAQSPDIEALKAAIAADEAGVKLARAEAHPDVTLMGGAGYRGRLDPMWMVGVSINLPRRSRVGPMVSEASYRRQADEAHLDALRRDLEARTRGRLAKFNALLKTIRLYAEGIIPQDRLAVQAALNEYGAGLAPFSVPLEAAAALSGDQTAWVRARQSALRMAAAALSLSPETETPMDLGAPHHPAGMR